MHLPALPPHTLAPSLINHEQQLSIGSWQLAIASLVSLCLYLSMRLSAFSLSLYVCVCVCVCVCACRTNAAYDAYGVRTYGIIK